MREHIAETDLALYVSGDLTLWRRISVGLHLNRCADCRERAASYRADREQLRSAASELPKDLDWDRLAAEMAANVRVGLAAGECVTPRTRAREVFTGWRPAAVIAGLAVLLVAGWWLNMPSADMQSFSHVARTIWRGGSIAREDNGPVIEATSSGIELRSNGGRIGATAGGAQVVTVSMGSDHQSVSARSMDQDTGQITVTSVYVE